MLDWIEKRCFGVTKTSKTIKSCFKAGISVWILTFAQNRPFLSIGRVPIASDSYPKKAKKVYLYVHKVGQS